MTNDVDVSISGGGLSYSTKTSLFKAAQIISFLNAPDTPQQPAISAIQPVGTQSASALSQHDQRPLHQNPREALQDSGATSNVQKILTLAVYHLDRTEKETFTYSEISPYFKRAGEDEPGNPHRDLGEAVKLNYIFPSEKGARGEYEVSLLGRELLQKGFGGAQRTPLRKTAPDRQRPKSRSKLPVSPSIVDELMTDNATSPSLTDFMAPFVGAPYTLKTTGIVYWLLKVRKQPTASLGDIYTCYKLLGDTGPGHLSQNVIDIKNSKGWLINKENGAVITTTGEKAVEQRQTEQRK